MASDGWVPEIVVGVDFGMTCTGLFAFIACIISSKQSSIFLNIIDKSRCRLFHGPRVGRAKDSPALARQDD